jgi:alcohol dehydrogenase class IV
MNAVCLPYALDFNRDVASDALARLGEALDGDPVERVNVLGRLGCPMRLRDYDVDRAALPATAEKIVVRPAAKANPRPASTEQILELLEAAW